MKVSTGYAGNMRFESGQGATRVVMDSPREAGGAGEALTPKQMVLQGLVGCTGMDVAGMLTRLKVDFEDLRIEAEATQTVHHPKVFKTIHITYRIRASREDRQKVIRSIEQSEEKFCGVSIMLGKTASITWELDLEPL